MESAHVPKGGEAGSKEVQEGDRLEGEKMREEGQSGQSAPPNRENLGGDPAEEEDDAGREEKDEGNWDHLGPDPDLEDVFEGLNLHGEEEEDLDLSG